ncbi:MULTISPECIES: urease accessory protein UreF [unclassified Leptolyngbya]|nr:MULTISPECIES: urease accessory protein UreF [unclassified Leptolyngbya]MBD1913019.1 urease accessory protein UreF [Leptolyngbya sp. FACHB-8]MBD2154480.1 urease accessory protein UreF [Leptolyngbya sp. FACHB-16]
MPTNSLATNSLALSRLLQLASPALPVGAYTYSEGLETLVQDGVLCQVEALENWIIAELQQGAIRLEAAIVAQVMRALQNEDMTAIEQWNNWLSALRETSELREQSWQMGRSLQRLLQELEPSLAPTLKAIGEPCNFAIAYGVAAQHWHIDCHAAVVSYLQSWATNLITGGVKLIPLGQTKGQLLLARLAAVLEVVATEVQELAPEEFYACGWGVAIASMNHETLYTRLYRS